MKAIHALDRIAEMRPIEFDNKKNYLIRIAPYSKVQNWMAPGGAIRVQKSRGWWSYPGSSARILSYITEEGYTRQAALARRKRNLRPMVDIARTPGEAKEIERLYDIDRKQSLPGTADRPNLGVPMYTSENPDSKEALSRLARIVEMPTPTLSNGSLAVSAGNFETSPYVKEESLESAPIQSMAPSESVHDALMNLAKEQEEKEFQEQETQEELNKEKAPKTPSRGPGRPKGSKNSKSKKPE